jgi:hypothetical protein
MILVFRWYFRPFIWYRFLWRAQATFPTQPSQF